MHSHERPRRELVLCQAGTPAALVSADSSCGRGEKVSDAKISHKEAKNSQRLGWTRGSGGADSERSGSLDTCVIINET